jgi:hypothetical protein
MVGLIYRYCEHQVFKQFIEVIIIGSGRSRNDSRDVAMRGKTLSTKFGRMFKKLREYRNLMMT